MDTTGVDRQTLRRYIKKLEGQLRGQADQHHRDTEVLRRQVIALTEAAASVLAHQANPVMYVCDKRIEELESRLRDRQNAVDHAVDYGKRMDKLIDRFINSTSQEEMLKCKIAMRKEREE